SVGSSFWTADSKAEPPTLSPAENRNEASASPRTVSTAQTRPSAPPRAPWKSLKVIRVTSSPVSAAAAAPIGTTAEAKATAAAPRPTVTPRPIRRAELSIMRAPEGAGRGMARHELLHHTPSAPCAQAFSQIRPRFVISSSSPWRSVGAVGADRDLPVTARAGRDRPAGPFEDRAGDAPSAPRRLPARPTRTGRSVRAGPVAAGDRFPRVPRRPAPSRPWPRLCRVGTIGGDFER